MKILLSGFGVVGKAVVQLLEEQRAKLYTKHGLAPVFVGVMDSKGVAIDPRGLDPAKLLEAKEKQGTVGAYPAHGLRDARETDVIAESEAQLLIEATPTTVKTATRNDITDMKTTRLPFNPAVNRKPSTAA